MKPLIDDYVNPLNLMERPLRNIYLIDDDPIHLKITRMLLSRHFPQTNISMFSDAREVVSLLSNDTVEEDHIPDVIFLDINMPLMDGWEFLGALEQFYGKLIKRPMIFMLSSSIDDRDRSRSLNFASVRNFISKPLSPANIESIGRLFPVAQAL